MKDFHEKTYNLSSLFLIFTKKGQILQMNDRDITFLEKIQLYKKLKSYFTKKLADDEKSNEELKTMIVELDRWGKDLKKRANYYDL